MKKSGTAIRWAYWVMIAVFLILMSFMVLLPRIPAMENLVGDYFFRVWLGLSVIFIGSGIAMMVIVVKEKLTGWLRFCLLSCGAFSIIFLVSVRLYNWLWTVGMTGLSNFFFYFSLYACPAIFIICAIVAGILLYRKKRPKSSG